MGQEVVLNKAHKPGLEAKLAEYNGRIQKLRTPHNANVPPERLDPENSAKAIVVRSLLETSGTNLALNVDALREDMLLSYDEHWANRAIAVVLAYNEHGASASVNGGTGFPTNDIRPAAIAAQLAEKRAPGDKPIA